MLLAAAGGQVGEQTPFISGGRRGKKPAETSSKEKGGHCRRVFEADRFDFSLSRYSADGAVPERGGRVRCRDWKGENRGRTAINPIPEAGWTWMDMSPELILYCRWNTKREEGNSCSVRPILGKLLPYRTVPDRTQDRNMADSVLYCTYCTTVGT